MMILRPRQGHLRLVFRLLVSCSAKPRMRLRNLKTCLRFPCLGLNTIIGSINPYKPGVIFLGHTQTVLLDPDEGVSSGSTLFAYRNFYKNEIKMKNNPGSPKIESGLVQLIMMGKSIRQMWVNLSLKRADHNAGPNKPKHKVPHKPRQANLCLRAFRHDKFQLRMPSHSKGPGI